MQKKDEFCTACSGSYYNDTEFCERRFSSDKAALEVPLQDRRREHLDRDLVYALAGQRSAEAAEAGSEAVESDMGDWTAIGTHELRVEPDLVFIRLRGMVHVEEARHMFALLDQARAERGPLYLLLDGSATAGVEPAARRLFVAWNRSHAVVAVANFGGGLMQRTLALLIGNAVRLAVKRMPLQHYGSTEAEARAWIAELRGRGSTP